MTVPSRLRRIAFAVGLALLLAGAMPMAGQSAPDIAVVVHPDVPVDNLSRAELKRLLLGDRDDWPSGQRVVLIVRAPITRERDAIVRGVCEMTEAQFRQHWIAKVFRASTTTAPKVVFSSQMTLESVSLTPGALGFIEAPLAGKGVKVLKIDGKAPGQEGYAIR